MSRSKYKPPRLDNWPGWATRIWVEKPHRRGQKLLEKRAMKLPDLEEPLNWVAKCKRDWWS